MNSPRVVTHARVTLNMATIKCFRLHANVIVMEHKTRYDYIQHPETGEYEKQEYNEKTKIKFPTSEIAEAYRDEWEQIWQEYLDDQS